MLTLNENEIALYPFPRQTQDGTFLHIEDSDYAAPSDWISVDVEELSRYLHEVARQRRVAFEAACDAEQKQSDLKKLGKEWAFAEHTSGVVSRYTPKAYVRL